MGDRQGGIASFGVSFGDGSKPSDGERRESDEQRTFRIVVLSELTAGADWSTGRRPPLDAIPIDAESFDRVMAQIAPSLAIDVDDPFGLGDPPLRVDLVWRDRKSMRPAEIAEQVPALRALGEAGRVVRDLASGKVSADAARAQLARMLPRPSWSEAVVGDVRAAGRSAAAPAPKRSSEENTPAVAPSAAPAAKGGLDALLDMVDVGSPPPSARTSASASGDAPDDAPAGGDGGLSNLVAAVARQARPGGAGGGAKVVGTALQRLERAYSAILTAVVRHPEVRRLEAAWRGLRLLVENANRRAGVEVDIVCGGRSEVLEALSRLGEGSASRAPVDLVVVDGVIEPTAADLGLLDKWAGAAEALLAPIVVGGGPEMVGADSLARIARSTSALASSDDGRAIAVRAVASREASRWLTIVLNDPLARVPYTAATSRLQSPAFEEPVDLASHVFTRGAYVVAALCARSHARLGWPTAITGARDGSLGNLPVHTVADRDGPGTAIPLEVAPSEDAVRELARAGLTLLTCALNTDAVILARAPALHRPGGGDGPSDTTLADQLFVGRFARAVQQVAGALPTGSDPKAAEQVACIALSELFDKAPPAGPEVAAKVDAARGQLTVTVRPRRFAGVSLEELTFGAAMG